MQYSLLSLANFSFIKQFDEQRYLIELPFESYIIFFLYVPEQMDDQSVPYSFVSKL